MNRILCIPICLVLLLVSGCSIVKVVDSWRADNAPTLKEKNTLVIARTTNKKARMAFEEAMAAELRKKGIQATESYKHIPELQPNKKLSEAELEAAKEKLREASFNGVVITVLKDRKSVLYGGLKEGHSVGTIYRNNYPGYYYDFYGYYNHPSSYLVSTGVEVEDSFDIKEAVTYVLETLAFNLDEPIEKQLVARAVATIDEPGSITVMAKPYASKIVSSIKQN
jgi:hypothetical protein